MNLSSDRGPGCKRADHDRRFPRDKDLRHVNANAAGKNIEFISSFIAILNKFDVSRSGVISGFSPESVYFGRVADAEAKAYTLHLVDCEVQMRGGFTQDMLARFHALLGEDLLCNAGKSFDFTLDEMKVIKSATRIIDKNTAVFLVNSYNWANTRIDMLNNMNDVFPTMAERRPVEAFMRDLVPRLRPRLDTEWSEYIRRANLDRDFIEGMVLPADFMFYCRECCIEKIGFQVPGHFGDLFKIYEMGVLPCGWDGPLPSGDILIY